MPSEATTLENNLTQPARPRRVKVVKKDGLRLYLVQLVGENPNKSELARTTGVPYHILVDIFRGKTQRPDPHILESLALGLNRPYDELALAAYGKVTRCDPAGADDTLEDGPPPAPNAAWNKTGRAPQRVSAGTS